MAKLGKYLRITQRTTLLITPENPNINNAYADYIKYDVTHNIKGFSTTPLCVKLTLEFTNGTQYTNYLEVTPFGLVDTKDGYYLYERILV